MKRVSLKIIFISTVCLLTSCSLGSTLNYSQGGLTSNSSPSLTPSAEPIVEPSVDPSVEESYVIPSLTPSYVSEETSYYVEPSGTTPLDFYKVSYYVDGSLYEERYVLENQLAENLVPPTHENEKFIGWYKNSSYTYAFDFSSYLTQDVNLYARYDVDYEKLTNTITTSVMKSVVTIVKECYNSNFFGGASEGVSATGSGIIYKEDTNYYYALTNNHVVYPLSEYHHCDYSVIDYLGNELNVSSVVRDPDYDLAVVKFSKGEEDLTDREFTITESVIVANTPVIALGQPQGQRNAITYGAVSRYTTPGEVVNANEEQNNIQFNVLEHTAYTASGSSGGPLLDINFNIVGINYASAYSKGHEGEFSDICFAVPGYKVIEFLNNNSLK